MKTSGVWSSRRWMIKTHQTKQSCLDFHCLEWHKTANSNMKKWWRECQMHESRLEIRVIPQNTDLTPSKCMQINCFLTWGAKTAFFFKISPEMLLVSRLNKIYIFFLRLTVYHLFLNFFRYESNQHDAGHCYCILTALVYNNSLNSNSGILGCFRHISNIRHDRTYWSL